MNSEKIRPEDYDLLQRAATAVGSVYFVAGVLDVSINVVSAILWPRRAAVEPLSPKMVARVTAAVAEMRAELEKIAQKRWPRRLILENDAHAGSVPEYDERPSEAPASPEIPREFRFAVETDCDNSIIPRRRRYG